MIIAMTSAEVSLALAMVVYLHRRKKTVNVDEFQGVERLKTALALIILLPLLGGSSIFCWAGCCPVGLLRLWPAA